MKLARQRDINHQLKKMGFGGFEDPQLLQQMAFCVGFHQHTEAGKHEHFRKILLAVEPEKRTICYEAMRPHLTFTAWPLDRYIIAGKEEAEKLQLPVMLQDGKTLVAYQDYKGEKPSIEVMAAEAIATADAEKALTLTCGKCTRVERFAASDRIAAYAAATKKGWAFEIRPAEDGSCACSGPYFRPSCKAHDREVAICPKCPGLRQARVKMAHA